MRHARPHKLQMSGPTVHSYTVPLGFRVFPFWAQPQTKLLAVTRKSGYGKHEKLKKFTEKHRNFCRQERTISEHYLSH